MPELVRFGERQHMVAATLDGLQSTKHPVVAMCGTVFKPKTWDPEPDMDRCFACVQAELSLVRHKINMLFEREEEILAELGPYDEKGRKIT